jgi:tetratricopeptide (TPR) repeat protein
MKYLLWILLLGFSCHLTAQTNELQQYYTEAMAAFQRGESEKFYELILKAYKIHPYHQGILYQAGIAAAMNNHKQEAIRFLKEAILIQSDFVLSIPELKVLQGDPEFEKLKQIQQEESRPIITSDTAFVLTDRLLHLESIAAGESAGTFYCGSIHERKIVKIVNGKTEDFTSEGQDGLCSVFGIKVDFRKKILWASSSPVPEMNNYQALLPSGVYAYDIRSRKLLQSYLPENQSLELVLGDLTLSRKGDVYVSDSKNNLIFHVNQSSGKLEQFYSSDEFWNLQGITMSDDGKYMFISDYIKGLFRLDMERLKLVPIAKSFDLSLKSVDGLSYYNNSLIAIQNYLKPMRVTQYFLNREQDKLISYRIIDRKHPAFNEPTLGCTDDDYFYYIANSQWEGYGEDHQIKPYDQLQDIIVLKAKLK